MSGKAADAGKTFMAGVLAKIPDAEKRAQVEAIFNDPAAADALVVVGAGALAQSDINRQYTELDTKKAELQADFDRLTSWYDTNKPKLDEYEILKAKAAGTPPPTPPKDPNAPPPLDPSKFISREDFAKEMNLQQMQAANYLALQNTLVVKHYKEFNEVLDAQELLRDPNLGKQKQDGGVYGLIDAYQTKYSTQLTERQQKLEADRINKLVDEKVAERMKGSPQLPFPVRAGGSPLDVLEAGTDVKPEQYSAQAAADEYNRLQQARAGAP